MKTHQEQISELHAAIEAEYVNEDGPDMKKIDALRRAIDLVGGELRTAAEQSAAQRAQDMAPGTWR